MKPLTREEIAQHLYNEGEDICKLNKPAGAILITLATALHTGVETELAKLCLRFAEQQRDKFLALASVMSAKGV